MVRSINTRSIVSFQTAASSNREAAQAALIATGGQAYTLGNDRGKGFSVATISEADVNINPVPSIGSVSPARTSKVEAAPTSPARSQLVSPTDEVSISPEAQAVLSAGDVAGNEPSLRAERLAQIQAEIEAGTYDTDAKFDAAVERMIDKLA